MNCENKIKQNNKQRVNFEPPNTNDIALLIIFPTTHLIKTTSQLRTTTR